MSETTAVYVTKPDALYRCVKIGCAFRLGGREYRPESWLVKAPQDEYARAMTMEEFQTWCESAAMRMLLQ